MPVIREKPCKSILNKTSISDYSLNCYTGCAHGCVYCYARFMQRFHPHEEKWGEFVDIKVNAVEVLRRQLKRAKPGSVFVSSACDGWQPAEAKWRLTRACCDALLDHGFQVNILTKSALLARDLEDFAGKRVRVGVTVTTLDERIRKLWEPNCAPVAERLEVIKKAKGLGLKTAIMFGPILPVLSDSQKSLDSMFKRAADLGVDQIWTDGLNPRPKVWPAVFELLQKEYPGLVRAYRQVLFDESVRKTYLNGLNERIAGAKSKCRTPRPGEG